MSCFREALQEEANERKANVEDHFTTYFNVMRRSDAANVLRKAIPTLLRTHTTACHGNAQKPDEFGQYAFKLVQSSPQLTVDDQGLF